MRPALSRLPLIALALAGLTGAALSGTALAAPLPAQLGTPSSLTFKAETSLFDVDGHFKRFAVTGTVDPDAFEASRVTVEIEAASIDTDNDRRDTHLRAADFFWAKKYPHLRFVTQTIEVVSAGRYVVVGQLTIKDTTRTVRVPVTTGRRSGPKGPQLQVRGGLTIDRFDHGIRYQSGTFEPDLKRPIRLSLDLRFDLP